MKTDAIRIQVGSDVDHEQLIAEVYIDGRFVALISQEGGGDSLKVEFPGTERSESAVARRVDLATFCVALAKARIELVGEKQDASATFSWPPPLSSPESGEDERRGHLRTDQLRVPVRRCRSL